MYYIKIPLRHLVRPEQLKVAPDVQQQEWNRRVAGLLQDISINHIPHWATDYMDLRAVKVEEERDVN